MGGSLSGSSLPKTARFTPRCKRSLTRPRGVKTIYSGFANKNGLCPPHWAGFVQPDGWPAGPSGTKC